jgi:acyl-coenzyme A synthetase/AMP-(fatty) acid ligase
VGGRDGTADPRRLRPNRDRSADRRGAGRAGATGIDGPRAAGCRAVDRHGELVVDATTVPTFFLHYAGEAAACGPWRTGDRVARDEDGYLFFEGRSDDVIISAGYRIGPFEVESALVAHEAVAEAAVVAAPDEERGSIVRAVVVLRDGFAASDELARALPKTTSGKVRRALLRGDAG